MPRPLPPPGPPIVRPPRPLLGDFRLPHTLVADIKKSAKAAKLSYQAFFVIVLREGLKRIKEHGITETPDPVRLTMPPVPRIGVPTTYPPRP